MKIYTSSWQLITALVLFFLIPLSLTGQNRGVGLSTLDDDETFFIGGLSPSILSRGQVEVNVNNSLFSVWLALHESLVESPVRDRLRLSEFNTTLETYYGFTDNGRWDMGARLRYGIRRLDNAAGSSPFKLFGSSDEVTTTAGLDQNYSGIREVGLRFRILPFEDVPQLTINAGYSFVPNHEEEVQEHLNADRNSFDLNIAYYIELNENASSYYYFVLSGIAYQPGSLEINDQWLFNSAASFYIVQRLGAFVIYPGLSYGITFKPPAVADKALIRLNEQVLGVLGAQYQAADNLNLNISTAIPFLLENTNLLQRQVRKSYSFVSIGGRILF